MAGDLDFALHTASADELGRLCSAFEAMRRALLESNPAAVAAGRGPPAAQRRVCPRPAQPGDGAQGLCRLLEQGLEQGSLTAESAKPAVALMGQYAVG